ncbi:MAG TPA: LTA synthase family protein [Xanthomonadaceae bacterium]|nr:LTA synthase family protein [Xanthomonadaceae bacterium]
MEKTEHPSRTAAHVSRGFSVLAAACALPFLLWLVWSQDTALADASAAVVALNALPALLLFAVVWILTRRPFLALIVTVAIVHAMIVAHEIKLLQTEQPLVPADFALVPQIVREFGFYSRYVTFSWTTLLVLLAVGLGIVERPFLPLSGIRRAIGVAVVLALGISLVGGWQPWPSIYSENRLGLIAWSPRDSAASAGMFGHFLWMTWHIRLALPAPDQALLADFRNRMNHVDDAEPTRAHVQDLPDIVIVQSESLFDPGRLRGLQSDRFLVEMRRLSARGLSGNLKVPAYGGLTTLTEFEVLTGYPVRTFNTPYPYQTLVHRPLHALPRSLQSLGYRTVAIHPYAPHFYRRNAVYPLLGFDAFLSVSDFKGEDYHGFYISDEALTRRIEALLSRADQPLLTFAVTIENHGPWQLGRPLDTEALARIEVPPELGAEDALSLRMYLHHLERADRALGELVAFIDARDRETLLLFFGDHLPALHGVFEQLGFENDLPPWVQPVPYLLLSNKRDLQGRKNLESHDLAALLLEYAGLNHDPYFADRTALRISVGHTATELPDAEAVLTHLTLERYLASVDADVAADSGIESWIADVEAWGPRGAEQVRSVLHMGNAPAAIWMKLSLADRHRPIRVRMGGLLIDSHWDDDVLVARMTDTQRTALLSRQGPLDVELVDPSTNERQHVGEFQVRKRAARIRLDDGRRAEAFCAVDGWGPTETPRDGSANPQPDGSLGLWFRASCWPPSPTVLFGDVELEATLDDQLVTAIVPRLLLADAGPVAIGVRDRANGDRLGIGTLLVVD